MAVTESAVETHEERIEALFREYHRWMRGRLLQTMGDTALPSAVIEAEYDVEETVEDDIAYLSDPDTEGRLFVARWDGEIVGCVYLKPRSASTVEVKRLYVRPSGRGHGLGRSLMEEVIDTAREMEYTSIVLYTTPFTEAAQSLYENLGFEYTAAFEVEAPEEAEDELVFMKRPLTER